MNFAEAGAMIEVGAKAAAPEMAERVSARENFILCLVFCALVLLDIVRTWRAEMNAKSTDASESPLTTPHFHQVKPIPDDVCWLASKSGNA